MLNCLWGLQNGNSNKFLQEPINLLQKTFKHLLRSSEPPWSIPFPLSNSLYLIRCSNLINFQIPAYNIAAGNVPPADPPQATSTANVPPSNPPHLTPSARLKRSRNPEPPEFLREYRDDAPSSMSHHDYIQNRRYNHFY